MSWFLAYLALGAFAGFFAGLLGVGGGAVMVPVLAMMFAAQGIADAHLMHLALGTSMATIIFTSVSSLRAHHQHGAVLWPVVRRIAPGIVIGTLLGGQIAAQVPTRPLAVFFALFMSYVAVQMILNIKPKPSRELPGAPAMFGVGLGIGGLSSLVAIGGGSLSVPFLTWCNVKMHQAIGTSSALGFPIAAAGMLTKRFVTPVILALGYRRMLVANTFLLGLIMASFAWISPAEPAWVRLLQLIAFGMINSAQFTAMNTITLKDLEPALASSGNSLLSMVMMLSMSMGVACAGATLEIFADLFAGAERTAATRAAFQATFVVMGLLTTLSAAIFWQLAPQAAESSAAPPNKAAKDAPPDLG